jgi:uncharacterized protein YybS (DUF2232 family)
MNNTKALSESACMAALTSVLALINIYVPVLGIGVVMVWTLPVVAVCVRYGVKMALCTLAVSSIVIVMLTSPVVAIALIIPCGVPALLLGMAFQKQLSTARTLFMMTAGTLVALLLSFTLFLFLSGMNLSDQMAMMREQMQASWSALYDMGKASGWIEALMTREAFMSQMNQIMDIMYQILPSSMVIYSLLSSIISYMLSYKILTRINISLPPPLPFRLWRWSWWLIWGIIIGLSSLLAGNHLGLPALSRVGINLISVFQWIYIINALSVSAFFIGRLEKRWRKTMIFVLAVTIVVFWSGMLYLMIVIGLVDMLFNLRKIPGVS